MTYYRDIEFLKKSSGPQFAQNFLLIPTVPLTRKCHNNAINDSLCFPCQIETIFPYSLNLSTMWGTYVTVTWGQFLENYIICLPHFTVTYFPILL